MCHPAETPSESAPPQDWQKMLLYMFAIICALSALFSWVTPDQLYQDDGERAAAERMLGYHGAMVALCTYPNGQYAPQAYSSNVPDPYNPNRIDYATSPNVPTQYPVAACGGDSGGQPVLKKPTDVENVQNAGAFFETSPTKRWSGYATVIQNNYVITVAYTGSDTSGNTSQINQLSPAKIGAALIDAVYAARIKQASMVGVYEKSSGKIRMNNGNGMYLSIPSDSTFTGISLDVDLLAGAFGGSIPDGTPVLATYLPTSFNASASAGTGTGTPVNPTIPIVE